MKTWKTNLEETQQRYINWWNHKGIILSMWEHFQEGVKPHADIAPPAPAKDLAQKWFDPQWRAEYLDWYVALWLQSWAEFLKEVKIRSGYIPTRTLMMRLYSTRSIPTGFCIRNF